MTNREVLSGVILAWQNSDAIRASAFFAIDATYREARGGLFVGRDTITDHFTRFFRDGPHFRFTIEQIVVDDDFGAVSYRFALATVDGAWDERAGCAFVTFRGSTIASWREYEG